MTSAAKPARLWVRALLLASLFCSLLATPGAAAAATPAWTITATSFPTNLKAGATPVGLALVPNYELMATNVGGAETSAPITITDTLPPSLTPSEPTWNGIGRGEENPCSIAGQIVTCTITDPVKPGGYIQVTIPVSVDPGAPASVIDEATVAGGGGALPATTTTTTTIDGSVAPFDFLPGATGFSTFLTDSDGSPVTQASSHPYQYGIGMGFSQILNAAGNASTRSGSPRKLAVDLPHGVIVNPQATPVRCTEAQFETDACPLESQVAAVYVTSTEFGPAHFGAPVYNMVPSPGKPAVLAFDVGAGLFIHLRGVVRSGGDYGLSSLSDETYAGRFIYALHMALWGNPTDPGHDRMRGECASSESSFCSNSVPPRNTAFLTMPSACTGPLTTLVRTNTWEEPGVLHEASAESADLEDNPVGVDGCNHLEFKPTIEAKPTTNLADSPSGLDVTLHQPQNEDFEGTSPAIMRDATVTLPEGLAVNPSSADGLGVCTEGQAHVNSTIAAICPDASKLGTVEVITPLLGHPLPGSVYLAAPFHNAFDSLLAIYLAVDDPDSGTVANLAGEVRADPATGQLTTRFEENPELPLEDIKLHLFGGARGDLVTPPTCGTHTTTTHLTPWSTPEGADATPSDSFQTTAAPGGGVCPTTQSQARNAPVFSAGTVSPAAGAFSPFLLKLSRNDGSQRLAGINTTLPPGLSGKLAGIPYCSEAEIAVASARSHPNEGALEQASPSCPAATEVGTVTVGAGAGPTPYYVKGHAYLAGPYKSAPVSLVIITPAVAGPFDLGAVVVRTALNLNPETAQINAVSDPLPTILDGIPLDLRSVVIKMDRSQFTLNPTSCDPKTILASASSTLGQIASLSSPFQVGGCSGLGFRPRLALRLSGGTGRNAHPALRAVLTAAPGDANVAVTSVALPHSEFLDQSHIRTVCTRVQFAAHACPAGAIYGRARAFTPLLDSPLEGPVYLRSSSHSLPDLVAALQGPQVQPIEVVLDGRIDSVNGGIRSTFDTIPDTPVSKFVLTMQGGKKGLLVNSTDLCSQANRAAVKMTGQNGKIHDFRPRLKNDCGAKANGKRRHAHHRTAR